MASQRKSLRLTLEWEQAKMLGAVLFQFREMVSNYPKEVSEIIEMMRPYLREGMMQDVKQEVDVLVKNIIHGDKNGAD